MSELREHANCLQQENERLRTHLETNWAENLQEAPQHVPLTRTNKGKEPSLPDHSDPPANDELSSYSSPLHYHSPPQNNAEVESRKRPPRHSNRAISGTRRRMQREASRDRPYSELAPEHMPTWFEGVAPQLLPTQYQFGATPTLHATSYPSNRGPHDMLSSPLAQNILDYKPPRKFVIPLFTMYDGSSDPYDHMLHFNQTMILNAENDRLLCKVFPAILKGPTLDWFHKLPRRSLNSFGKLWATFVSQYLCSVW